MIDVHPNVFVIICDLVPLKENNTKTLCNNVKLIKSYIYRIHIYIYIMTFLCVMISFELWVCVHRAHNRTIFDVIWL